MMKRDQLNVNRLRILGVILVGLWGATSIAAPSPVKPISQSFSKSPVSLPWSDDELEVMAARYERWLSSAPVLSDIVTATFARHRLDEAVLLKWERDLHRAAFLPRLLLSYDLDLDQRSTLVIEDNVSVTSDDVTVGPESSKENYNLNQGQGIGVKLQWDFSQALYHRDQLAMSRERQTLVAAKQNIMDRLSELYRARTQAAFKWWFARNGFERAAARAEMNSAEMAMAAISGVSFPPLESPSRGVSDVESEN